MVSPSRGAASAASSTASVPARWPRRGWRSLIRPPRKASSTIAASGSSMAQLGGKPRLGDEAPRLRDMIGRDEQAARKGADRAFEHADMRVGDEDRDRGMLQERLHEAEHDEVVRADDLDHAACSLPIQGDIPPLPRSALRQSY